MQLSSKFKSLNYLSTLVKNNTSIGIGGHHFARLPIALINNLLNKNPKNLEFISWSGGLALELFLQKNAVKKIQICFSSLDIFGLAPIFRRTCENKKIQVIDWSALGLIKALRAGQQNIDSEIFQYPWGSDLPLKTNFCKKFEDPISKNKFAIVQSLKIDNFLLHASRADEDGNVEILGPRALDTIMAGASKRVIVTVDEIVSRSVLAKEKKGSLISKNFIKAIAHVPYGAYPTSSVPYYITDYEDLKNSFMKTPLKIGSSFKKNKTFVTKSNKLSSKFFKNYLSKNYKKNKFINKITSDEIMAFALASEYDNTSLCSSGAVSPLANVSYLLAKKLHAPKLILTTMTYGHHDVSFRPMTLSFSEVLDRETCINYWGGDDSYSIYYQNGQITHEVIGAAQIDKFGDVNNIEIKKKSGGMLRLPGQGGMADVSNLHQHFICYVTKHSKLSFVEKVDYVSAGRGLFKDKDRVKAGLKPGDVKIFTNLCIFEKNKKNGLLEVTSIHKGVTKKEIQDNTSFKIKYKKVLKTTKLPTQKQLNVLRKEVDPLNIRKLEFTSGQERIKLLEEIISKEKIIIKSL
ncbi:MAG: CoA-transferase [Alphaproteobacteria bacterium]